MTRIEYKDDLARAVETLREGGVILYPTDTIWGLGCDATNPEAVAKVYALKKREETKSMLVLVASPADLSRYSEAVPEIAYDLIEASDRPVTLVLDKARMLAPNLIGTDGSIGIRVTAERFSRDLCRMLRRPIVSTSANLSGAPSAAIFSEIAPEVIQGTDYVAYYRREENSPALPSIVIKLSENGEFKILRQ